MVLYVYSFKLEVGVSRGLAKKKCLFAEPANKTKL